MTCSEVPQQLPRTQGARCQTLQGIPEISLHFKAHLSLKTRDFQELGTSRVIPAIYSFVLFQMLFFPKNFSGYVGHVTVILSTDRAGLCSTSENANEHINKIKTGPNLDLITQSQEKVFSSNIYHCSGHLWIFCSCSVFPNFCEKRAVCGDCTVATEWPILFWIFMHLSQNHLGWKGPLRVSSPTFDLSG